MKFDEIIKHITRLAHSRGFYGRLLATIYSLSEEDYEAYKQELEAQNFKDVLDLIYYFECD